MPEEAEKEGRRFRMDFVVKEINEVGSKDGGVIFHTVLIPNPDRYEEIEIDGERCWRDRFTEVLIREKVLAEATKGLRGVPIYYSPPKENDVVKYLRIRRNDILASWDREATPEQPIRPIDYLLEQFVGRELHFVIMYIDMEGSTRISAELDGRTNTKLVKMFLMEICNAIDNYLGYVLKTAGDSVLAVFPAETNFTHMCDNAIQASMTIRAIVEDVLSPFLVEKGLPSIGFHIGLDIGKVRVDTVGAKGIAAFLDLIGHSMNLTAKIQSKSGHNEVLLGRNLFELLHCDWQRYCEEANLGPEWVLSNHKTKEVYTVYRYTGKWNLEKKDIDS